MLSPTKPVVVIGLDAAEPALIRAWVEAGELPVIAGLMAGGRSWRLSSPAWMSTGPIWPCFYAGTSPARHGRFFFRQLESGTYRIVKKRADAINATPFWEDLTKAGAKVAVVDVPKTTPKQGAAATQIVGWGVHSAAWRPSSVPSDLLGQVTASVGAHPVPNCDEVTLGTLAEYQEFLGDLSEGIARKEAFARKLLGEDRWDLFLLVFSEAHCAGHRLWHLHDGSHPDHDREMRQKMGDPLLQIYRRLDAAIGAVVSAAGDATVVLFSPHGMGPNYGASHLLPEVLERLGLGAGTDKGSTANGGGGIRAAALRDRLIGAVPDWSVRALRGVLPAWLWDALTNRLLSFGNTWAGSSAFCVPGDFAGAIRINLLGREPSGRVRPGSDFDALCEDLKEALMELKEVDSGRPAVKDVVRIDKVFAGEALDQLPDLMVCWMDDQPIKGLSSPRIGEVRGTLHEARSGEDRSDGFLVISGCSNLDDEATRATADLMDLAPTITELMGLRADGCFDGRSLLAGLDAEDGADEGLAR